MARKRFSVDSANSGNSGGTESDQRTAANGPGEGFGAGTTIDGSSSRTEGEQISVDSGGNPVSQTGPADPAEAVGTGTAKAKRKYTRRSAAAPSGLVPLDKVTCKNQLQGYSVVLSLILKAPIVAYTDEEAEVLADKLVEVSRHYDLNIMQGPKAAIFGLVSAFGMISFNKLMMAKAIRAANQPQPATQPATPTDAGVNAGLSANVVNLTGDHLSTVRMP